jgi:hypothetical protein
LPAPKIITETLILDKAGKRGEERESVKRFFARMDVLADFYLVIDLAGWLLRLFAYAISK